MVVVLSKARKRIERRRKPSILAICEANTFSFPFATPPTPCPVRERLLLKHGHSATHNKTEETGTSFRTLRDWFKIHLGVRPRCQTPGCHTAILYPPWKFVGQTSSRRTNFAPVCTRQDSGQSFTCAS